MTAAAGQASRRAGALARPEPHLGRREDRRFYLPPESVEPRGILDGEIIAGSSGSRIFVRQTDAGYVPDHAFGGSELPPDAWREEALALLAEANGADPVAEPAAIESFASYQAGIADVAPPDYRLQLHFASAATKAEFLRRLTCLRRGPEGGFVRGLRLLDDSHPAQGRYKAFLLPRWASKSRAASRIVSALRPHTDPRRPVDLFFAGDSYPDLGMGLFGAPGCPGTLLLVGGSRLAKVLRSPVVTDFAGERLEAVKRRLEPTRATGVYRFRVPRHASVERHLVLGDVAYPGTGSVVSIEHFLAGIMPLDAR